jgi:valyl-tRNA synthetase
MPMDAPSREPAKSYDPSEVESHWYSFWKEKGYFHADEHSRKPPYCIVLPPPNVTGSLHLGHALTATLQDLLIRWKRMSGFNALWLPGTDHAGIATQMVVEREIKAAEHKSRHDLGREEFVRRVWQWKEKYGRRITEQHQALGASLDWERERFTMDSVSSRAVREVFVRLFEEGLIYRAQRLINWCVSCRTALSDLEVEHEEKDGHLWHIAYPVKGSDTRLMVATTRPETMLGDTAVAVHPDDPRYRHLIGRQAMLPLVGRDIAIIGDAQLVSMEFGTGAVKVTPGHDFNDYETGLRHGLAQISVFDEAGRVTAAGGPYQGLDREDARKKILKDLEKEGLLGKTEPHRLAVGTCQRCGSVVEPILSPQWFVKVQPLAAKAIDAVESGTTQFVPESWTQTYLTWMRNIRDWCISRQLWWGHQIPAWQCSRCHEFTVSREDPTRCARCGAEGSLARDPDVLDTWFSSALWPFSTLGWPERTKPLQVFYPNSVMETGHDIIFFWVARMMMMGRHFMGQVPFRTVYLHPMVRDENGEKMSKTRGNVIDPLDIVHGAKAEALPAQLRKKYGKGWPAMGADALRFTLASMTAQGRDIKLSIERIEGYRAFANKLWNAARFAEMNLGGFVPEGRHIRDRELALADRWILSRLNRCVAEILAALEEFRFNEAANAVYQFTWHEFCDWYIELSKGSLSGGEPRRRASAQAVLVYVLDRIYRLLHPFMPFVTEELWQKLPRRQGEVDSIMIAAFPKGDALLKDAEAEGQMAPLIAAIDGLRNIRGESNIAPGRKIPAVVHTVDAAVRDSLTHHREYVTALAGLESLAVQDPGPKPPQSAAFIDSRMEIFVPLAGVIDLVEESGRLRKEIAKIEGDLATIESKLGNANFVSRAPPEVVEKDRARLAELRERRDKLNQNLTRLGGEESMAKKGPPKVVDHREIAEQMLKIPDYHETTEQESGEVKVVTDAHTGTVDLAKELAGDVAKASLPAQADPSVREALNRLRKGTKTGLSKKDHYDLGVAYMSMGLVDEAVREFNVAGVSKGEVHRVAKKARAKAAPRKPRARPRKKAPAAKGLAKRRKR